MKKDQERFLLLYNALHETQLLNVALLKNIKLEQVMYMSFSNDVSYLVENKIIVRAEHQSTINPNMPLCCLEYVSRLYEKYSNRKKNIHENVSIFQHLNFMCFTYGIEPYPCNQTIKLSDAFQVSNSRNLKITAVAYSCGGFNTPTLCVVTKGIKADCNHLMRTTCLDALRRGC